MAHSPIASIRAELHRFGLERDRFRAAIADEAGIAQHDLDALEHLEADGPLTQRELGDRLHLTSGAITMLVDRLEQANLVGRRPHPSDRRATLVHLSPAALERMPGALAAYHDQIAAAARAVSAEHRPAVAAFLAAARDAAADATARLRGSER